ncbi:hypothetical protein JG688_00006935 [Phytophthora aleatoria]|uniref:PiggyBac transposable element-derived protein domain-containing protein n=1 Tax=Phytophthora aleatoria TaxID=2496075 RepID=A0A8J5IKP0_9STRA|nr:hypothetical protein JG688_00006935 [Phytophthora aleatoria]
MGGMDVHDQLRLQRYSLQRAVRFRKYCKPLVLGLIDLAIVNGYFVHKAYHKHGTSRPLTPVRYLKRVHLQLCQLQASGMHEAINFGAHQGQEQEAPAAASVRAGQATHAPQLVNAAKAPAACAQGQLASPCRRQACYDDGLLPWRMQRDWVNILVYEAASSDPRGSDDLLGYSAP